MGTTRLQVSAAVVVVLALMSGCQSGSGNASSNVTSTDSPEYATRVTSGKGGLQAQLHGTLASINNCLVVQADDGSYTIPIFPIEDTSWVDGALVLSSITYKLGESVEFGGSGVESPAGVNGAVVPSECAGGSFWSVAS